LSPSLQAQGTLLFSGASKQSWCLMAGSWRSLCGTSVPAEAAGAGGSRDPPPNPAVMRGQAVGLLQGSSSGAWFPVPHLAGKRLSAEITYPSGLPSSNLLLASVKLIGFEVPGTNEGEKPMLPMCGIIERSLASYNCKSCFEITLTN